MSVAPPSPQEIHRKLSIHSPTPPRRTASTKRGKLASGLSGTESDSDNTFAPQQASAAPERSVSQGATNERFETIGEETDDEEEEVEGEEGEWRKVDGIPERDKGTTEETLVKSGYLWKKGERRKTWKKRWFVLRPDKLSYYKNDREYQLHRLLDLNDVHSVSPVSLKKHTNTFGIVTPTRTFYIQASSPSECDSWVKALNEVKTQLKDSVSTPTLPIPVSTPRGINPLTITPATPPASSQPYPSPSPPSPQAHHLASSDSDDPYTIDGPPRPISKDPHKAILSGYLMKCGSKRKNWRKRWFVLTSEMLIYTKSHMDNKAHREIPLDAIVDAIECTLPQKHHVNLHHHSISPSTTAGISQSLSSSVSPETVSGALEPTHSFKIITPKRPFLLCAPSEEEEIKWLSAVRALIARRSSSADVSSKSEMRERTRSQGAPSGLAMSPTSDNSRTERVEKRRSALGSSSSGLVSQ